MKPFAIMNFVLQFGLVCALACSTASADPIIRVGKAATAGTKTIVLTYPGGTETVTVSGIVKDQTPTQAVVDALNASKCCGGSIDAAGRVQVGIATAVDITSTTGEEDIVIAGLGPVQDPTQAVLAYAGTVQGFNGDGGTAVYGALLSFSGLTADVTVPFGSLASPNIFGALSSLYAGLLPQLDPLDRLRLTLTGNALLFDFPIGAVGASASIFSTDTGLASTVGIHAVPVPEPFTVTTLGTGLISLVAFRTKRRR